MKKNKIAAVALTACIAVSVSFGGCSLVSTNSNRDMEQEIASINITQSENFASTELSAYKDAISVSTSITKRELVSYFLNTGYSYVQNGYSYEDTFNMLMDALVNNAVLVQYSTMSLLKDKAESEGKSAETVVSEFKAKEKKSEKYEYLLTPAGATTSDEVMLAKYTLYSSVNSAIDNYEKTIIDEDKKYEGTGERSTPTNVDAERDKYYPKDAAGNLDYNIYTGYEGFLLSDSGIYKDDAIEGTTRYTRIRAYNSFLNNLRRNNIINDDEADKFKDVTALNYFEQEYASRLESRIINKYFEYYEAQQKQILLQDNYIDNVYRELLNAQKENFNKSSGAFENSVDSMSSSSFVLYTPDTSDSDWSEYSVAGSTENLAKYGLVYNILLPFDSKQTVELNALKSILSKDDDDNHYYAERNKLLKAIQTEDQRAAWFNGKTDYSFKAEEGYDYFNGGNANRSYLFFEDNLNNSSETGRYKKLEAYDGRYSYNGNVYENEDGSYTLIGNRLDIDGMLSEFEAYIEYILGSDTGVQYNKVTNYYDITDFTKATTDKSEDDIDYSLFIYASGKVNFGDFSTGDFMNPESMQYKVMSAVNELQYAYTTDTGVLSQYAGYSVSAYDTSYIKEFELAAKLAVSEGVGSFVVCAGDYGWHLIYVTYVFDAGDNYQQLNWQENVSKEGTFENLFFEWIKGNDLSDITSTRRSKILKDFNDDSTVTKYTKRYQDLLDLKSDK